MKTKLLFLSIFLFVFSKAFSQDQKIVTGEVIDSSGKVSYATITESSTKKIVTADVDGKFTIHLSSDKITVSATGHQTRIVTIVTDMVIIFLAKEEAKLQEFAATASAIRRTSNLDPHAAHQSRVRK